MIQIVTKYFQHSAWAKNGSFGFAKGRLVCRAKPNVPFVRLAEFQNILCGGKKNKTQQGRQ
jgi:hypothetical protein